MPRFAANLSLLYPEHGFLDRFEAAARDAFEGVEFLFPYAWPAAEITARLRANGLQQVLFNAPPGDWDGGERGLACLPGREAEFREGLQQALRYARDLGCERLHVMAGRVPAGLTRDAVRPTYVANLRWAAALAAREGVRLMIEPINGRDMPGYFLNDFDQAARIVDDIGSSRLGLQFDLWHAARIHGDADAVFARHRDRINHIQIAGFPARNEPGGGGFDLTGLCAALDEGDWPGFVAAEYIPARATVHGLLWLQVLKRRSQPIGA